MTAFFKKRLKRPLVRFGGFGGLFAALLSDLVDPGGLVLRLGGFLLLLLLRVFRDVFEALVLQGGGGE